MPSPIPAQDLELDGVVMRLTRKRIRHLRLSVHPPGGDVRVSAPLRLSTHRIVTFVASRLDWIRRQQQTLRARPQPIPHAYVEGETHVAWGRPYALTVVERHGTPIVEIRDGRLVMQTRPGASTQAREALLREWYRALVERAAPALIATWEPVMGVAVARVSARRMTSRWGSCTPRTRHIRLSLELAKAPPEGLEYVVVHEMVHLLEASHNARFARLMDRIMPDWRARRDALNRPSTAGPGIEQGPQADGMALDYRDPGSTMLDRDWSSSCR